VDLKKDLFNEVLSGDVAGVKELTAKAIQAGLGAQELLNDSFIAAMQQIGERFERGDAFVPEMLLAARGMKAGLEVLRPHLVENGVSSAGKAVVGTVAGDMHDIGKNLVITMLEGSGFEVYDLGINQPAETFVEAVRKHSPRILGMSALLTSTMPGMKTTIDALVQAGVRDQVIIMIGGAPVNQEFANQIGADIYAPDAASAARKAKEAMEG